MLFIDSWPDLHHDGRTDKTAISITTHQNSHKSFSHSILGDLSLPSGHPATWAQPLRQSSPIGPPAEKMCKMNKSSTGQNIPHNRAKSLILRSVVVFAIAIAVSGCSSYGAFSPDGPGTQYQSARNPSFIFERPITTPAGSEYASSELFGRRPWPTAPAETSYIMYPEIVTYQEYRYDRLDTSSDNKPRVSFRNRIYGYRQGKIIH